MSSHATNPIGVIGAGTMGTGIAQAAAAAGWSVRLCDIEQTLIEQAESNIVKRFERLVEKGRITNEQSIEFQNRITTTTVRGCQNHQLVRRRRGPSRG